MPRSLRVFFEGGLYHVDDRFARGESVFAEPEEAIEFVELLRQVKRRDGLTVFAWALLSNHYHVVLRTSAFPVSRTMHYVQGTYSRRFNRRWRRTGPLWQSRYQARVIDDQEYFDRVVETAALRKLVAAVGIGRWASGPGSSAGCSASTPLSSVGGSPMRPVTDRPTPRT